MEQDKLKQSDFIIMNADIQRVIEKLPEQVTPMHPTTLGFIRAKESLEQAQLNITEAMLEWVGSEKKDK